MGRYILGLALGWYWGGIRAVLGPYRDGIGSVSGRYWGGVGAVLGWYWGGIGATVHSNNPDVPGGGAGTDNSGQEQEGQDLHWVRL